MNNGLAGILPQEGGLVATGSGKYNIAMGILALLSVVGVAAGVHSLYVGHEHTFESMPAGQ
jgi:molybdopterin-containing oxidoreductase family membrane subunit